MSYAQAMRWHKKHPTGGKAQYMGFDTSSAPEVKTEAEIREFHRNEYLAYHKKNQTDPTEILTENAYVKAHFENYERKLAQWNRRAS